MNTGKDVVNRIDILLKEQNQKRQTLADYANISVQAFTNWTSRGNFPPSDIALKIAEFLNVPVEYLITGENPEGWKPPSRIAEIVSVLETLSNDDLAVVLKMINGLKK